MNYLYLKLKISTNNKNKSRHNNNICFDSNENKLFKLSNMNKNDFSTLKQGLILNRLAFNTCDEIINGGCKLLSTYTSLTPLRKLWIAWKSHLIL